MDSTRGKLKAFTPTFNFIYLHEKKIYLHFFYRIIYFFELIICGLIIDKVDNNSRFCLTYKSSNTFRHEIYLYQQEFN